MKNEYVRLTWFRPPLPTTSRRVLSPINPWNEVANWRQLAWMAHKWGAFASFTALVV